MERSKNTYDTWNDVWRERLAQDSAASGIFRNPLFVEGLKVYEPLLPQQPFSMLELGSASGRYGLWFAAQRPDCHFTITDFVPASVQLIEETARTLGINATIEQADATKLKYADNSFDVVFADGVLPYIPNKDKAIAEIYRVLKPRGIVIMGNANKYDPLHNGIYKLYLKLTGRAYEYGYEKTYTRTELKDTLQKHGFSVTHLDGIYLAYGMYRWGYWHKWVKTPARALNRIIKIIDSFTARFLTKRFGFMVVAVGMKNELSSTHMLKFTRNT